MADHTTNVLVTGASRGIGLEFVAQLLARPNHHVFAAVRSPSSATALLDLQKQHESSLTVLQLDVSSEESIKAAAKQLEAAGVRLDMLINNAAKGGSNLFCELDQVSFLDTLNINVVGPYLVVKHFLPFLRAGTKKLIANISSRIGSVEVMLEPTAPGTEAILGAGMDYRISKAALNYETAFFAKNLSSEGFTVVCLHPGWVDTDMGNEGGKLLGRKPPTSPVESVEGMLKVFDGLDQSKDNGKFLSFEGGEIPW